MVRIKESKLPKVYIEADRDAYSTEDLRTMTIGELISCLEDFDSNSPVYLSYDKGYTFGALRSDRIDTFSLEDEDEDYDDEEDEEEDISEYTLRTVDTIARRITNALAPGYDERQIAWDIYRDMKADHLDIDEALEQWIVNTKTNYPEYLRDYSYRESTKRFSKKNSKNVLREDLRDPRVYTFFSKETKEDPISAEDLRADNIFDAIRILEGYEDEYAVKKDIAKFVKKKDPEAVTEEDAADFWTYLLDNQPNSWDRISRIEGPDFIWESDTNFELYDDYYEDEYYDFE